MVADLRPRLGQCASLREALARYRVLQPMPRLFTRPSQARSKEAKPAAAGQVMQGQEACDWEASDGNRSRVSGVAAAFGARESEVSV